VLVAFLGFATAAPAQAGILDTIKGFFGKATDTVKGWFSGGGEKEFVKLLEQVATSQQALTDKQTALMGLYQQRGDKGPDATTNERLNDLAQASRQNEALYLSMLKARDELQKGKKDITKYQDALTKLTEQQNALEQQYQELQNYNRKTGAFTPPATIASATNKATAGGEPDWHDSQVQGFIDEYLGGVGLTEWGQYIAPGAQLAGPPDHGSKQRHEWVWENMQAKSVGSNMTLNEYVRARMGGQAPVLKPIDEKPSFVGSPSTATIAASNYTPQPAVVNTAAQVETAPQAAPVDSDYTVTELKDVVDQEKAIVASIQQLNTDGQGNSEQAQKLYESLKAIQSRKNDLMKQQGSGTGAAGSITTPR
jgi:hypothetical protein